MGETSRVSDLEDSISRSKVQKEKRQTGQTSESAVSNVVDEIKFQARMTGFSRKTGRSTNSLEYSASPKKTTAIITPVIEDSQNANTTDAFV